MEFAEESHVPCLLCRFSNSGEGFVRQIKALFVIWSSLKTPIILSFRLILEQSCRN